MLLCLLIRGYPILGKGYPIQSWMKGTPSQVQVKGTPSQGVPHPILDGSTQSQVPVGGYPIPGGTPSSLGTPTWSLGTPPPSAEWGTPIQTWDRPPISWNGYSLSRLEMGYPPPGHGMGYPPPHQLNGVPPPPASVDRHRLVSKHNLPSYFVHRR